MFAASGKCKYGAKCKYSHDEAACAEWKASNPSVTLREVPGEEGVDENMNPVLPPELEGMVCEEAGVDEEEVPQMLPDPDDEEEGCGRPPCGRCPPREWDPRAKGRETGSGRCGRRTRFSLLTPRP